MQKGVGGQWTPLKMSQSPTPLPLSPSPPQPPLANPSSPLPDPPGNASRSCSPVEEEYPPTGIPRIQTAIDFVKLLKTSTLASQFEAEELADFLHPGEHDSTPPDDPILKLSLLNFISFLGSSQHTYEAARQNLQLCFPEIELLSYYQVERRARNLSGVITWEHHMCVNSCVGFTGPYSDLEHCPRCGESRYNEKDLRESDGLRKVPRQVFTTFPVGPQIQARWKHPDTAKDMRYRWERTRELRRERARSNGTLDVFDDILCGEAYLDLVDNGDIKEYDSVLMLSMDGVQLYESKKSDCWIYVWILVDLAPDKRYQVRNILPGGVIPGPEPPGDFDSFLFPGLAHISALQREGLPIWDSYRRRLEFSFLFLLLVLADTLGMTQLSGSVGHHGHKGCRLLCGFVGRNKVHGSHYYPALLRPIGFEDHLTSGHPDVDVNALPTPTFAQYQRDLLYVISSRTNGEYKRRRFDTGIGKPSIFAGISRTLPLPTCFPGDVMHQPLINLAALLLDLWCARPAARSYDASTGWPWAVLTGDIWKSHGEVVSHAAKYLPTSFGRTPRNPQEKISSGYKAWESLYYLYGEGPGVFFQVLPEPYYSHFCRLVRAVRVIFQRAISRDQMIRAHQLLLQWVLDFELIYCKRNPDRLHFVRQCVHSLTHLARETHRLGPLWLSSQWTMERTIGYLGSLLRQPSNVFRNLAAQTSRVANTNALVAMWPELQKQKCDPQGSKQLGDGYVLLGPKDTDAYHLSPDERTAFDAFFGYSRNDRINTDSVCRWGRLKLPTEQIARSRWKELERCSDMMRTDRNVKVRASN